MTDATVSNGGGLFAAFASPFASLGRNRFLIAQLIKRTWAIRYRGTAIGFSWLILKPLILLAGFVFIRGIILSGRIAPVELEGLSPNFNIAVFLFCGLMFFFFSSEIMQRAPGLILNRRGYVKRLVFPLETFAYISVGAAILQFVITYILLIAILLIGGAAFSWLSLMIFVLFIPLILLWSGVLWLIGSIGVFVRDLGQFTSLMVMAMLFLGPIFYSLEDVPEEFRSYLYINPLTFPISQTRVLIMEQQMLDWQGLGIYTLIAVAFFYVGYFVFNHLRRGFPDVL